MPGGTIDVTLAGHAPEPSEAALKTWVELAGRAVAGYYGSFPVPRVALTIRRGGSGKISSGRTEGSGGEASIRIDVGEDATAKDLEESWVLVHEMVHLALPSLPRHHAWLEEGIATYVEPLARARAGLAPREEIWKWLLWGLPKGQEALDGRGLEEARGWSATYWGGALFCFLADVGIRERAADRKSLDDALRGIVRAGGNVTVTWPIERVLQTGDTAAGVPVLTELYAKMGQAAMPIDLHGMFQRLGVSIRDGRITYDDGAALAAVRRGITTGH